MYMIVSIDGYHPDMIDHRYKKVFKTQQEAVDHWETFDPQSKTRGLVDEEDNQLSGKGDHYRVIKLEEA